MTDGPLAEAREIAGGFIIVAARDLEPATVIARGIPSLEHPARPSRCARSALRHAREWSALARKARESCPPTRAPLVMLWLLVWVLAPQAAAVSTYGERELGVWSALVNHGLEANTKMLVLAAQTTGDAAAIARDAATTASIVKQLDVPAIPVAIINGRSGELKVASREDQAFRGAWVLEADAAQMLRTLSTRIEAVECSGLVADGAGRAIGRTRVGPPSVQVRFCPGYEGGSPRGECEPALEIEVGSVHDIEGARLRDENIEDVDVV